jgi:cellulose synthase/poly-beta-1,6-N-acetylglucosamine synthase-like glycosyltransferase
MSSRSAIQGRSVPALLTDGISENETKKKSQAGTDISEEVKLYAAWLDAEALRNNDLSDREETFEYVENALKNVKLGNAEAQPFAPFRQELSALRTLTSSQARFLGAVGLVCALGLLLFSSQTLEIMIALATVFYLSDMLVNFVLCVATLGKSAEQHIDDEVIHALADADWPRYTILCPVYHEASVVPQFVEAMKALDYPVDKLQILFLTEEDDAQTRDAIEQQDLPRHFKIVTVPAGEPRTKPRACNFGLLLAKGDYVVIYDAEDIPEPLQLKKAVLKFAHHGPDLACVQAKLNFYNTNQNLLTRWFTAEYSTWFDLILPGLQRAGLSLPLGGTSNHIRTEVLGQLGGWDAFNVTEDCDLGLRMVRHHLKTAVVDSTTYEEATSEVKNWMRQRSRWVKGYMQTYLVHMRHPQRFLQRKNLREFLSLQLVVGGKTAVLFVNPLMWALLLIYVLLRSVVGPAYHELFPHPVLYMGVLCLIFGNFFYLYIHLMGCFKRGQYSLIKWTLLMPIYWALSSAASFIALYQLIFIPHYWAKTRHGLHLNTSDVSSHVEVFEELEVDKLVEELQQSVQARPLVLPKAFALDDETEERPIVNRSGQRSGTATLETAASALDEDTVERPGSTTPQTLTLPLPGPSEHAVNWAVLASTVRAEDTLPLPAFHLTYLISLLLSKSSRTAWPTCVRSFSQCGG